MMKILTFSFDTSPSVRLELLSTNSLYDLVDIAFRICRPAVGGDVGAQDHLWYIKIVGGGDGKQKDDDGGDESFGVDFMDALEDMHCLLDDDYDDDIDSPPEEAQDDCNFYKFNPNKKDCVVKKQKLGNLLLRDLLKVGMKLQLTYDYGSSSTHFFELIAVDEATSSSAITVGNFPRRKPEAVPAPTTNFSTPSTIDLNKSYQSLNRFLFSPGVKPVEVSLFQAGRKQHYGYLEAEHGTQVDGAVKMIYLPDAAESFNHYLNCLEGGANTKSSGWHTWHSIVVLPSLNNSKKADKYYFRNRTPGFIDCKIIGNDTNNNNNKENDHHHQDLSKIFPLTAALGGFKKHKIIKKGWIHYRDETLVVVMGAGATGGTTRRWPQAPKGTAYDGDGFHSSGFGDNGKYVLFRIHKKFHSIHELFCEVEGLLGLVAGYKKKRNGGSLQSSSSAARLASSSNNKRPKITS